MKQYFYSLIIISLILTTGGTAMAFEIKSSAFSNEGAIPSRYTCDGSNVSPPFSWSGAPAETKAFALICDDPDAPAGTWVHWVAWNIPATSTGLKEGTPPAAKLPDGTIQGISDFKRPGYGGPCPPSGTHRYFFKIYALNSPLNIPQTGNKAALEAAMAGHTIGEAMFMGTYSRQR